MLEVGEHLIFLDDHEKMVFETLQILFALTQLINPKYVTALF